MASRKMTGPVSGNTVGQWRIQATRMMLNVTRKMHTPPTCLEVSKPATVKVIQSHTSGLTTEDGKPPQGQSGSSMTPNLSVPTLTMYCSPILYIHTY